MTGPSILYVHPSDEAYGADRMLLAVVVGMQARGYRPTVLLPVDTAPGWLTAELRGHGIEVQRTELAVAARRRFRPLALPGYLVAVVRARAGIRRWARRVDARIIHVNTSAILAAGLVGRPGGARLVWHVHELVISPWAISWLMRLVPPLAADRVIAVSDAVRRHLTPWRWLRGRVVTVHNGLPARPSPSTDGDRFAAPIVALVGRINRWKGQAVFVSAIARFSDRFPTARFVIAGGPPPGEPERVDDLRRQVMAAGLEDRIELRGPVPDGAAIFDTAAVAVVPSIWPEPFGLVVLEAMQAGCAVIATNHGGAAELVEPGTTGILVPPGDAGALADAMAGLLADPEHGRVLGQAARAAATERFGEAAMLTGIEAVYRAVLA